MPTEVVGVKEVMKGLSFIDEDMYKRIKTAIDPLMRQVESDAKGYVPSNTEVLSGWSKPISSDYKIQTIPKI
jgi:DNA replication initiation complex subunit (GINS family)